MLRSCIYHQCVLKLETEIVVQRARQSTHRNHRGSDQHRTDGNLHHQQHFPDGNAPRQLCPFDPALITSYGLVRSTCLTGTAPKRNPLAIVNSNAMAYTLASGFTAKWIGHLANGCHALRPRNSTTLPQSPMAPPTSEISTASVNKLPQNASRASTLARAAGQLPGNGRRHARQTGFPGWRTRPAKSVPPAASIRS